MRRDSALPIPLNKFLQRFIQSNLQRLNKKQDIIMCNYKFDTLQLHAGQQSDKATGAIAVPIFQTTAYDFHTIEHAGNLFALKESGYIYTRLNNPTVNAFEQRVAALEGGSAAVATSSGMSAEFLAVATLCETGDNIVSSAALYGGTYNQFKQSLKKLGITVKFPEKEIPAGKGICGDDIEELIDERTKAVYVETIANSDFSVPDFETISAVCKKHRIPLIVDNTLGCGGYICRPKDFGANIIVHSATKSIGGHGNSLAGVIIDCGNFNWDNGKFESFVLPDDSYHGISFFKEFGNAAFAARVRCIALRDYGCSLSPFNAFLLLTGCETLSLRAQRAADNTLKFTKWLQEQPEADRVNYPGLQEHPSYKNAKKYLRHGFGAVFTADLNYTKEETVKIVESLKLITLTANLGDNRTLVSHPASTIHAQLTKEELERVGLKPGTIRLSIGIEDIDDIIADFRQALSHL